jgi:hypothetical protein
VRGRRKTDRIVAISFGDTCERASPERGTGAVIVVGFASFQTIRASAAVHEKRRVVGVLTRPSRSRQPYPIVAALAATADSIKTTTRTARDDIFSSLGRYDRNRQRSMPVLADVDHSAGRVSTCGRTCVCSV